MTFQKPHPQPVDTTITPRFAGVSTFMRLPEYPLNEVDIALLGVPFDLATTNRPGTRHGPKQVREMSAFIRRMHHVSKISPFEICRVADCGDAPINPMDMRESLKKIEAFYRTVRDHNVTPFSVGGDHLMSYPILKGLHKDQPFALIQFDAHSDTFDEFFGSKLTHGTGFRRAIEDGIVSPKHMVQIGLRGAIYDDGDLAFARESGVTMIDIERFHEMGVEKVIEETRKVVGDMPVYLSFDIDALDPVYAPGTGTPEIGGLTTIEATSVLRGLQGLNFIGGDVVEVSPPFDMSGNTALTAATMMFEMLCLIADARANRK